MTSKSYLGSRISGTLWLSLGRTGIENVSGRLIYTLLNTLIHTHTHMEKGEREADRKTHICLEKENTYTESKHTLIESERENAHMRKMKADTDHDRLF